MCVANFPVPEIYGLLKSLYPALKENAWEVLECQYNIRHDGYILLAFKEPSKMFKTKLKVKFAKRDGENKYDVSCESTNVRVI
jgi:hypothetical protein